MGGVPSVPTETVTDHLGQCYDTIRVYAHQSWVQTNDICSNSICSVIWPRQWSEAAEESDITYLPVGSRRDVHPSDEQFQYASSPHTSAAHQPSTYSGVARPPMPYLSQPRDRALYAIEDDEEPNTPSMPLGSSPPASAYAFSPTAVPHYSYRPPPDTYLPIAEPVHAMKTQMSTQISSSTNASSSTSSGSSSTASRKESKHRSPKQSKRHREERSSRATTPSTPPSSTSAVAPPIDPALLATPPPARLDDLSVFLSPPLPNVPGVPTHLPQLRDRVDVRDIVDTDATSTSISTFTDDLHPSVRSHDPTAADPDPAAVDSVEEGEVHEEDEDGILVASPTQTHQPSPQPIDPSRPSTKHQKHPNKSNKQSQPSAKP